MMCWGSCSFEAKVIGAFVGLPLSEIGNIGKYISLCHFPQNTVLIDIKQDLSQENSRPKHNDKVRLENNY